jgi:hypothetical protein
MRHLNLGASIFCIGGLTLALLGCCQSRSKGLVNPTMDPPPPIYVWTPEKDERLQRAEKELAEIKRQNFELDKMSREASDADIEKLIKERDRLKQKRDYLAGEIEALIRYRTLSGGVYTPDKK